MLLDVMSPYNNLMINTKMIKVFGLSTAAYSAVLMEIIPRVLQKKYDEEKEAFKSPFVFVNILREVSKQTR